MLLAGPTASGKSALAMRIAERIGGTIVNADSMQVYRDLRVLTARPDEAEERAVPHALYGHVDGAVAHSVRAWRDEVHALASSEAPLIVIGGTGLYFNVLTRGLAEVPPIPEEVRAEARVLAADNAAELHARLAAVDPTGAGNIDPTDAQRLARAWEVVRGTGRSLSEWQAEATQDVPGWVKVARKVVLAPDRAWLRARIVRRLDGMVEAGTLGEVEGLLARGLDPGLPVMRAIGVPELTGVLRGDWPLAQGIERTKISTGQYAKRQDTWFRNQFGRDWTRFDPASTDADEIVRRIASAPSP